MKWIHKKGIFSDERNLRPKRIHVIAGSNIDDESSSLDRLHGRQRRRYKGGSQNATSTTNTIAQPPDFQIPFLKYGMDEAKKLYDNPPKYFEGNTVAPLDPATKQAQNLMLQRGLSGSLAGNAAEGALINTLNGNYINNNPTQNVAGIANGSTINPLTNQAINLSQQGVATPGTSLIAQAGNGGMPIQGYLESTANGSMLNANPYLDQTFDRAADAVERRFKTATMPGITSEAEAAGALGSGMYALNQSLARQDLGNTLSGLANDIYGQNYQFERGNQINAANLIQNASNAENSLRLGAGNALNDAARAADATQLQRLGLAGSLSNQNLTNQMTASGLMNDAFQSGLDNQMRGIYATPNIANMDYQDIQAISQVGADREAYNQALTNADIAKHNWQQELPINMLAQYMNLINGNYGGSSTSTQTTPYHSNTAAGALGGGLSGAMMGAQIGSIVPGIGTGIGALIGGGLGLFSGFF